MNFWRWMLLVAMLALPMARAANVYATALTRAAMLTARDACGINDVIIVPSGSNLWQQSLSFTNVSIIATGGMNTTWITNGMPDANSDGLADGSLWSVNISTGLVTVSGFSFTRSNGTTLADFNGSIVFSGAGNLSTSRVRFCSNRLDNLAGTGTFWNDCLGVVDHNTCTNESTCIFFYVYHPSWSGNSYSDGSWTNTTPWGGEEWLFFEDNFLTYDDNTRYAPWDAYRGARYVVRYNTIRNGWVEMHGTDSGQRYAGTRAVEVYENSFTQFGAAPGDIIVNMRSGSARIWNNRITNFTGAYVGTEAYRRFKDFSPWGSADGTNPWDTNYTGGPFDTGISTAGGTSTISDSGKSWTVNQWVGYSLIQTNPFTGTSGGANSVTVAGAGWTTDQWAGYEIRKTMTGVRSVVSANTATTLTLDGSAYPAMDFTGGGSFVLSRSTMITANTATTLTLHGQGSYVPDYVFTSGQGYAIFRVYEQLDQPGTYRGQIFSATATPSPPANWPTLLLDPIYEWGNTNWVSGTPANVNCDLAPTVREGRHVFTDTAAPGYAAYTYPHPLASGNTSGGGSSNNPGVRGARGLYRIKLRGK